MKNISFSHKIVTLLAVTLLSLVSIRCNPADSIYDEYSDYFGLANENIITIASFNIENVGITKVTDPVIAPIIAGIIRNFDIVAIQEISDQTLATMGLLLTEVNKSADYSYIEGPRLGRGAEAGKEQYAFIYKNSTIELQAGQYTFNDVGDVFEREPFIAKFKVKNGNFDFVLVNVHVKPDDATAEINALPGVMTDAATTLSESDVICLGDYNADGTYYTEANYLTPFPADQYVWIIPNSADTTVAFSSNTYDRITATISAHEDFVGISGEENYNYWGVFRYDYVYNLSTSPAPGDVSDHYPVWAKFFTGRDTD